MPNDAIVARQLVKHFSPEIRAVDGIDLAIPHGQIFAFLGQNGSGKTTTVRMLTTLLRPTSGDASVNGVDVKENPAAVRRCIGVALQESGLDEMQTGRELLQLQAGLHGLRGRPAKQRAGELLEIVGLADAADRLIKGYSGGMQRRLDLAAALVHNPPVVFLDEPTTGLDPVSRESMWRYVSELNTRDGVTFFLTTQYLEEADRLAHAVAIMDAGRIVASGSPDALKAGIGTDVVTVVVEGGGAEPARAAEVLRALEGIEEIRVIESSIVVYVGEGARAISRVVLMLDEAGISVGEITLKRPTLDDVFLRATGHHIQPGAPAPKHPEARR